jgi:N-formylmaleamate deformylase
MRLIEHDIAANDVRLHVYRTGTTKPPLVFAHGIMDDGLCFQPIAEQLAGDFEIVLCDARGHGKSDPSTSETTLLERARDLGAVIDALELNKPGLIGHSLGAVTVALCAGMFPEMPGRIVLEDPPPLASIIHIDDPTGDRRARWREWAIADKERSVDELVQISRERDPGWSEAERLPWARAKQLFSLSVFDEGRLGDVESLERVIAQIVCPMLVITADPSRGSLLPLAAADELAGRSPQSKHVNIPGAGHNIRREQPQAYLNAVRDFLKGML